ncbi:MAG TPA: hypothetical protein DCS81_06170, partial [Pantoea septica]|nr:hypothetical protein [Pantoea septica]
DLFNKADNAVTAGKFLNFIFDVIIAVSQRDRDIVSHLCEMFFCYRCHKMIEFSTRVRKLFAAIND